MRAIQILLALILLVLAAAFFPEFTRMLFGGVAGVAVVAVGICLALVLTQIAAAIVLLPIAFIANAVSNAPVAIARLWRKWRKV